MTVTATSKDESDHFWNRVRTALNTLRPVRQPAYGQAAIARSIGMKPKLGTLIEDELAFGWTKAAEKNVSLSLMVIEIDRALDYFSAYDPDETHDGVLAVMQAIANALPREGDRCLRMGRSGFVVVLPDLPVLMAKAVATKIADAVRRQTIAHKESHAGIVTVSLGLAVTNPRGAYDKKFFEAGAEALKKAQRKGLGYQHSVDLRPALDRKKKRSQRLLAA
ncbi:diguanylate cyclase (GGDEF) domain-containing protein [Devosia sp. YR412]|uniref:diguanylate cyclase domain-containing protein n=1 Tax=Devosia sp. YR412 TaxID=1881030 RepID=UPI0008D5EA97|nr:GGDEF domain-containing protein [Devosia sp. YR412]SEP77135.1 diguanylate cyclase (GGDEF) domain-containing protein [Devosia sp. YR412]